MREIHTCLFVARMDPVVMPAIEVLRENMIHLMSRIQHFHMNFFTLSTFLLLVRHKHIAFSEKFMLLQFCEGNDIIRDADVDLTVPHHLTDRDGVRHHQCDPRIAELLDQAAKKRLQFIGHDAVRHGYPKTVLLRVLAELQHILLHAEKLS